MSDSRGGHVDDEEYSWNLPSMSARWISASVLACILSAGSACSSSASDDAAAGASAGMSGSGGSATGGSGTGGAAAASGSGGTNGGTSAGSGATGGAAAVPDLPSVNPETNLRDMTDEEKGELCDWEAAALGGYGHKTTCSDGSGAQNYSDQAQCIALDTYSCLTVTVGDVEGCTIARIPTGGCVSPKQACGALYCIES